MAKITTRTTLTTPVKWSKNQVRVWNVKKRWVLNP